jgi:PAS domain
VKIGRRTLIGSDGSLIGVGEKLGALEGLSRVSNETRRVFDLWLHTGRPDGLPRLAEFPFAGLVDLLPSILIVDVIEASHDYRYRQAGAREIEVRGEDPIGRTVRQCYAGDILSFVLENYDRVVANGDALLDFSVDINRDRRFVAAEVLFVPFSDVGVAVTEILVYSHYLDSGPGLSVRE